MSAEESQASVKPFELCDFPWHPESTRTACVLAIARFLESQAKLGWRVSEGHDIGWKSFTFTPSDSGVFILSPKAEIFEQGTPETLIPYIDMLCHREGILTEKSHISIEMLQDELNRITESCQSHDDSPCIWTFAGQEPPPMPPPEGPNITATEKCRQRKDFKTAIDFHGLTYNTAYMLTRTIFTCLPESRNSDVTLIVGKGQGDHRNSRHAVQSACQNYLRSEMPPLGYPPKDGKITFTLLKKAGRDIKIPVSSDDMGYGYFQKTVGPNLLSTFPNPQGHT